MRSNKFHDALRRPAFDVADRRGNNPHGTREQADAEARRLNGYRYETVQQVERALDPRARRLGEAPPSPASPSGGGGSGGGGLFWLLAAAAGIALLASAASDGPEDDEEGDDGDGDGDGDGASPPLRENPAPAASTPSITVNLTMPHGPPTTLVSNPMPAAPSEPVHVTVPVMAPVVLPPPEPLPAAPALSPAAPLLNPEKKKRRRSKSAG